MYYSTAVIATTIIQFSNKFVGYIIYSVTQNLDYENYNNNNNIEIPLGLEKETNLERKIKESDQTLGSIHLLSCHCKHNSRSHYKSTHNV